MIIETDIKDLMAKTLEQRREGICMQMKIYRICCLSVFFPSYFSVQSLVIAFMGIT